MPGQRKRRHQQANERERAAARLAADAGRWEVVFETQDESEWRAHIRRLRAADNRVDWTMVRMDTFCGRLMVPTTYRLSMLVPNPASDRGARLQE